MVSCNQYDYIEIACMYKFPLLLTLKSGVIMTGIALDTQRNERREECLKLTINDIDNFVVLDTIAKIKVTIDNPHFHEVSFD